VTAIGGVEITINGIAKGAGMIAPDMATMLSFVFTDAPIAAPVLQALLSQGVQNSFNAITVDSDTSTSDTLLAVCDGWQQQGAAPRRSRGPMIRGSRIFTRALNGVLLDLAQQVVRTGGRQQVH